MSTKEKTTEQNQNKSKVIQWGSITQDDAMKLPDIEIFHTGFDLIQSKQKNHIYEIDERKIEEVGKRIYQQNSFFQSLSNVMEHPEFKNVFNKHFKSWDDIEVFVMFLKLYEKIGDQFPEFNGYQKLYLVKSLIDNSETRYHICNAVHSSFKDFKNKK